MKNTLKLLSLSAATAFILAGCATPARYGKDDFRVHRDNLRRGTKDFRVMAFYVPDLGAQGGTLDTMAPAMARIAEVGGNTVCFDLAGFNDDGTALDPACIQTVGIYAERGKNQRMGVMLRVLGDSRDPTFRMNAVKTAAKTLAREGRVLYWIDGPNAAELAEAFRKAARKPVVVAVANGDIAEVDAVPAEAPELPVLVSGSIPDLALEDVHFVLPDEGDLYAKLDQLLMNPAETAPWTPDNSLLSAEEREAGFIALCDGKSLDGWWIKGDNKEGFQVNEAGEVEWVSGGAGGVMTRDRYDNYTLRMDWKILEGGNSGVWFRAPREARQSKIGFEFQMRGDSDMEEHDKSNTGAIYDVIPPLEKAARPEGEWNELEVILDGPYCKVTLNGVVIQDLSFDDHEELRYRLRKGFICLTDHGNYVAFRNIRLKKL